MNTQLVYFISPGYRGPELMLTPRVPTSIMDNEDNTTKRICCSLTVDGAMKSLDISRRFFASLSDRMIHFWLYSANVLVDDIIKPTFEQVPDIEETGELWVVKPQNFKFITECVCDHQHQISGL